MKCPVCGFITDPSKDLCSRCFSDLRFQKKVLGFSIVDETSSYEELLAKRVKIVDPSQAPRKSKLLSFFGHSRNKKTIEDLPVLEDAKENPSSTLTIVESETLANVEELVGPPSKVEPVTQRQKLKLSKRQKGQIQGLLNRRKQQQQSKDSEIEAISRPLKAEKERLNFPLQTLSDSDNYIWKGCFDELKNAALKQHSEISVASLVSKDSQAALALYFDLSFEELARPGKRREFIKPVGQRQGATIESKELKAAVGQYKLDNDLWETDKDSAPPEIMYGLGGIPAGFSIRLLSFFLDMFLSLVLAFSGGMALYFKRGPILTDLLLGEDSIKTSDILSVALAALPVFFVVYFLALPFLRRVFGATFGEYLTSLRLVSFDYNKLGLAKGFAWNIFQIFSIFSLGLAEIRWRPNLWREKVLSTKILRT